MGEFSSEIPVNPTSGFTPEPAQGDERLFASEVPADPSRTDIGDFGIGEFGNRMPGVSDTNLSTFFGWSRVKAAVVAAALMFLAGAAHGADTYTPHLGLRQPAVGVTDNVTPWGTKYNNDFSLIDTAVYNLQNSSQTNLAKITQLSQSTVSLQNQLIQVGASTHTLDADLTQEISDRQTQDAAEILARRSTDTAISSRQDQAAVSSTTARSDINGLFISTGTLYWNGVSETNRATLRENGIGNSTGALQIAYQNNISTQAAADRLA